MIAVDTNIVVRLLTRDDEAQYQRAYALFEQYPIFIATTVILETVWVLSYAYHFKPDRIAEALRYLFGLEQVHIEQDFAIAQALDWYQAGMDFADALHLSQSQSCLAFYTFDKKMARKAKQLTPYPVNTP